MLKEFNRFPEVEEREVPAASGDEVVIRQSFTGICFRDILTLRGKFPRVRLPIVPGHEVSGIVAGVGEKVKSVREGDRVSGLIYMPCGRCSFCAGGRENLCRNKRTLGEDVDGSYAPYVKLSESSVVSVPAGVSDESSVIAACVTGMLIQALVNRAKLSEGEAVLVTGAGGGVGAHAIQVASAMGARVIAETSSQWKVEGIHRLGADSVVPAGSFSGNVKSITNGEGVDIVIETVGSPTFRESLKSLNYGGRLVLIGNVEASSIDLPLGYVILKGLEIIGSVSSTRENVAEALELSRKGLIKPVVDRRTDLEHIEDAYAAMEKKSTFGRVLIDLADAE